ncbi:MAG: glycosyltransferase [Acidimicrobiia bacterium]
MAPYPTAGQRHAGPSGVASYTANLAHALAGRGARVQVLAPHEPDAPLEPEHGFDGPVAVHRCFTRGVGALRKASRAAAATGAPVVHLQHELFLYGGPESIPGLIPGLAGLRRRGRRCVVTLHQVVAPSTVDRDYVRVHRVRAPAPVARGALQALQRSIAELADACVVHEREFAALIPGSVPIAHGVEQRGGLDRDEARARLGVDGRFVVLCFGFVSPYKGLEAGLEAGKLAGPDVLVVVAGGAHPRLAAHRDPYAGDLARRHGGPGARFTGWVPESDVGLWHTAADVALLAYPKPFASSGALALALAHGTPALLSPAMARCTGAPPALSAPLDPPALARHLRGLADDPERVATVGRATASLAEGRAWPAVAEAHLRLYEDVLR